VTLEVSARRRSNQPVKNLYMKTENVDYFQIQIHTNRQERDETNVTNDDVFRSVCSGLLETDIPPLRRYDA
jgi:hypothetical protein